MSIAGAGVSLGRYKEVSIETPGAVVIVFTITDSAFALTGTLKEITKKPESAHAAKTLEIFTALQYLDFRWAAP